jgi:uncharacterized protein (TIGR02270 family)
MNTVPQILCQHAEEAALTWLRRDRAVAEPHYRLKDLAKLDGQLEAHLDGLRIAEAGAASAAWEVCEDELRWEEPGEVFSAAVLALESSAADRIERVLDVARASYELSRPLVSALGWLPYDLARDPIRRFIADEDAVLRRIGIAAAAVHRHDPGEAVDEAIENPDSLLQSRAARAAGELGRVDLLKALRARIGSPDPSCGFWAAWSVGLLAGDGEAVDSLRATVESNGERSGHALQIALRRMDVLHAKHWIRRLAERPALARSAVIGAGLLGDPDLVPWLTETMQTPALARVAGEAVAMITGVDIAYQDLDGKQPDGFSAGPTEDPEDDNVAMDPDENLPWPDARKIAAWWAAHRACFEPGTRYLAGQPMTVPWLNEVLRNGYQRQRAAAAMELAIRQPDQPLFEVRAPGFRQQEWLGSK